MVHFKPKVQGSWGKGFLTSVMGTTISIILTFGTSAVVERKVKADIQRQTAMMVIHDIDVCVDQMEEMAKEEEKRNNAVQYVLAHLDQIASLPMDTLQLAMFMFPITMITTPSSIMPRRISSKAVRTSGAIWITWPS